MTITREYVNSLPEGGKKEHYKYILNDMMRNDEWAMNVFKDVGVVLTSHPGNRPFLKASLETHKKLGFWTTLVYDNYFDPNNNFAYTVANCMVTTKPGFSVTDGYNIDLELLQNGTQQITFTGPAFIEPLSINSAALSTLLESGTSLVADTPNIDQSMSELLIETGIFSPDMVGEDKKLSAGAKLSEEFILKFNGKPDYEIIDIGEGKGRNILRYDLDKIAKKVEPFINAEVAGLLSAEQEAIAAWNVFLSKETSVEEDDQMVQNANAGSDSWSYTEDLPLMQDKKVLFAEKYKIYFFKNYLTQFITNKLPSVEEDAAVFDLEEGRKAKAQQFVEGNQ